MDVEEIVGNSMSINKSDFATLFISAVRKYSPNNAIEFKERKITYAELFFYVINLTLKLKLYTESHVVVYADKNPSSYIALLATILGGKIYVPINPKFPNLHNQNIINQIDQAVFLYDIAHESDVDGLLNEVGGNIKKLPVEIFRDEFDSTFCIADEEVSLEVCSSDVAYMLFTSGTTGAPKGIEVSHGNLVSYVKRIINEFKPLPSDRFSHIFDLTFDLSLHDILVCLFSGACLCVPTVFEESFTDIYVQKRQITWWFSVPSVVRVMIESGRLKRDQFKSVRMSMFCGEALSSDIARHWKHACINSRIVNLYGPTECTIAFTMHELEIDENSDFEADSTVVPIGLPLSRLEVAIIDEEGNIIKDCYVVGELMLGGDQVAVGYWKKERFTREKFLDKTFLSMKSSRWYKTGDLASYDKNGLVLFHGRIDNQVKVNGYRIEVLDIEHKLCRITDNKCSFAVVPKLSSCLSRVDYLVAYYSGSLLFEGEIRKDLIAVLPSYCIPKKFIHLSGGLPLNNNGKIDRALLAKCVEGEA